MSSDTHALNTQWHYLVWFVPRLQRMFAVLIDERAVQAATL